MLDIIEAQMQADDKTTVTQLGKMLSAADYNASKSTIIQVRRILGWTFNGTRYRQILRTQNKDKRISWAFLFLFSGGLEYACKFTTIVFHRHDFVLMVTASPIWLHVLPIPRRSLEVDSMYSLPSYLTNPLPLYLTIVLLIVLLASSLLVIDNFGNC